jgi:hypothetical protein
MPCASLSPPPSPSPVKGEGIEEVKSLPEITQTPLLSPRPCHMSPTVGMEPAMKRPKCNREDWCDSNCKFDLQGIGGCQTTPTGLRWLSP